MKSDCFNKSKLRAAWREHKHDPPLQVCNLHFHHAWQVALQIRPHAFRYFHGRHLDISLCCAFLSAPPRLGVHSWPSLSWRQPSSLGASRHLSPAPAIVATYTALNCPDFMLYQSCCVLHPACTAYCLPAGTMSLA